jgi:hypothetical protein
MWYGIRLRSAVGLACLAILLPAGIFAFHYPLQSNEIEQAYYLGQSNDHDKLASFLQQYQHEFSYPSDNPIAYVQSIEFQTPYEQIVLKSMRSSLYDKFKAADDYRASAGAVFVRVVVALKIGFAGPIPKEESFQVIVSQGNQIQPKSTTTTVLCNPFDPLGYYTAPRPCDAYTREILLRFDHGQFSPGKATVQVTLPDERSIETTFNLGNLK